MRSSPITPTGFAMVKTGTWACGFTSRKRKHVYRHPWCKSVFVIHRNFRAVAGTAKERLIGHKLGA